jgi:hypothetical protein
MAGLGDNIICLAAAWLFARNTQRTLVADWRHSRYADSRDNLFPLCFEPGTEIAGVPFIADIGADVPLPPSYRPGLWQKLMRRLVRPPDAALPARRDRDVALILSGADVPAATVVFDACVNDGIVSWHDARSFLGALRPVAHITAAIETFVASSLGLRPWIGLHIRHGNGGDIMGHGPSWATFDQAIDRCARAVAMAREQLGQHAVVLLCTDSYEVLRAVLTRIPQVICRPKAFYKPGTGEMHHGFNAAAGRDDALVEMLLLARCSVLIRYPSASFFSFYGAVMKPSRLPPPVTISDLQVPCDATDHLAPALLF